MFTAIFTAVKFNGVEALERLACEVEIRSICYPGTDPGPSFFSISFEVPRAVPGVTSCRVSFHA